MAENQSLLHTEQLVIGYHAGKKQAKAIAGPLDLHLYAGELICLLGPNGCGKSTLLRTIAGLQLPLAGAIDLEGESLLKMKPTQLARKLSLVLTDNVRSGNLDVQAVVALGRYPYSGWLGILTDEDKQVTENALLVTHTATFATRKIDSLSDGECQKVMLARAIAQDTPLIILDEPTAHLDLPSRIQLMRLLHQLARETNKAILISTHELDLALQVADQIWLMDSDGNLVAGLPEQLILDGSFQKAFDKDGISFDAATGNFHIHDTGKVLIVVEGEGVAAFWTRRALARKGYRVLSSVIDLIPIASNNLVVIVESDEKHTQWIVQQQQTRITYLSLISFLDSL